MDPRAVSDVLGRLAFALEVLGGATHEARAFATASRIVRQLPGDLRAMLASGALAEVRGIGRTSLRVISDALEGREPPELRELEAKIPEGLFAVHSIKGLGPAKIRKLWQGLGITTIGELEHACRENRLILLDGFGPKTQANVLAAIEDMRRADRVLLRSRASALVVPLIASLRTRGARAQAIGDFARGVETVSDLGIVVAGDSSVIDETLAAHGVHEGRIDGTAIEIVRAEADRLGAIAVLRSSSGEHAAALIARARTKGLSLRNDGLWRGEEAIATPDDDAVYQALGLATTAAERREPGVPLVEIGRAVPKLVELRDLRGALHNHTIASDGAASEDEMRAAAASMGLSYLGISDHSVSAHYARGLSAEDLIRQATRIAEERRGDQPCVLLSGVESDIRADGSLDYDPEVLAVLEVVIASVHKRFSLDRAKTTERMVLAARNPFTDVIGHPTGRLLGGRPPNDFDIEAMLQAAREHGCAVELNASPHRLDLDARGCAAAKERGVLVSIAADAHAPHELRNLEHGIAVARHAGLSAEDVLNARTLDELRAWFAGRRRCALANPSA